MFCPNRCPQCLKPSARWLFRLQKVGQLRRFHLVFLDLDFDLKLEFSCYGRAIHGVLRWFFIFLRTSLREFERRVFLNFQSGWGRRRVFLFKRKAENKTRQRGKRSDCQPFPKIEGLIGDGCRFVHFDIPLLKFFLQIICHEQPSPCIISRRSLIRW